MGRPNLNAECRRRLREDDRSWHIKAILRALAGFSALLALVLFAHALYLTSQFINRQGILWLPLILVRETHPCFLSFLFLHELGIWEKEKKIKS